MQRVLAGAIAILLGLTMCAVLIWLWVGGSGRSDSLGWAAIIGMFTLPVFAMAMALGLLFLEGLASWLKRPRVQVLLLGPIVIPVGLFLMVGAPYLLAMPFNPSAGYSALTGLMIAAAAIAPCLIVSAIYAALTRHSVDRA